MRSSPFFGSDARFDESRREECGYLVHTARLHIRFYRLRLRDDSITAAERAVLIRIYNDLRIIIAAGSV